MKYKTLFLLITLLVIGLVRLPIGSSTAQEGGTPPSTPLQRPTLLSTGLPPVSNQTVTPRPSVTPTFTLSPQPSRTPTKTATLTSTSTLTVTATLTPTSTATVTATVTRTNTSTASATATHTHTSTASVTNTLTVTATTTATVTSSATSTGTVTGTNTPTRTPTPSDTPSPSATNTLTATATASPTQTATFTNTPTATATSTPINIISSPDNRVDSSSKQDIDPLILIGGGVFVLVSLYVITYALSSGALDRYATGFLLHTCPTCQEGHLTLEERPYRILGIPRVRRTVRCDNCRSVLREMGRRRWRYTVDPHANPALFEQINGSTLTEAALLALAKDSAASNPEYVDEE